MSFYDFNTAESNNSNLIPNGTIAKVHLHIKPGAYNNEDMGFNDGYAKHSEVSGAVYLNCEYTIISGKYAGRKIWDMIGLHSNKNDNVWGKIGRTFIRNILNSAKGFRDDDESESAINARKITSFSELESIEFVAKIGIKHSATYGQQNIIKSPVGPEHREYATHIEKTSNKIVPWE